MTGVQTCALPIYRCSRCWQAPQKNLIRIDKQQKGLLTALRRQQALLESGELRQDRTMGTAGFGGLKVISKVGMNDIVNTHFRYQLRNVEFKVGIFLYWHKL